MAASAPPSQVEVVLTRSMASSHGLVAAFDSPDASAGASVTGQPPCELLAGSLTCGCDTRWPTGTVMPWLYAALQTFIPILVIAATVIVRHHALALSRLRIWGETVALGGDMLH